MTSPNKDYDVVYLRECAERALTGYHSPAGHATPEEHMMRILAPVLAEVWQDGHDAAARWKGGSYREGNPFLEEA